MSQAEVNSVTAIVEQTAEIFVSRARPIVPSLFWQILGQLLSCLSCTQERQAEVFGGVLFRANLFLPPVRHDRILCL